jgi:hypothetical protein
MFKKRGKIRAVVLIVLGVIIGLIFVLIFFSRPRIEKSYTLTEEELIEFNNRIEGAVLGVYPECWAFLEKDISYCDELENVEDLQECYLLFNRLKAVEENDVSYIDALEFEENKEAWKEFVKGTLNCDTLDTESKTYCLAGTEADLSYCEDISGDVGKADCKNEVGIILAAKTENVEICDELSSEWIGDFCKAWITGKKEACINEKTEPDRGVILKQMASENDNENLCYAIKQTKERELCILEMAVNKDYSLCDELATDDFKEACSSVKEKDLEKCQKVEDSVARSLCEINLIYE